jgi:hypothetical protein
MSDKPLSAVDEIMDLVASYGDWRRDGHVGAARYLEQTIRAELEKLTRVTGDPS